MVRHTYVEAEARREKQTSAGQGKQSEGARYTRGRIYEFLFAVSFSSHAKRSCLELHTSSSTPPWSLWLMQTHQKQSGCNLPSRLLGVSYPLYILATLL